MNEQPSRPTTIDQSGQTVLGNQTNIAGDVNTTWPRVATSAALVALLAFTLLFIELATNWVERLSGLSLQTLLMGGCIIDLLAWTLAGWIFWAKQPWHNYQRSQTKKRFTSNRQYRFPERSRQFAQAIIVGLPILTLIIATAYYTWRIHPTRYTTILIADFVSPTGIDDALITEILVDKIRMTLIGLDGLRVKRLNRVIALENGSDQAKLIGNQPWHKAAIVIWGNYAIVGDDPEIHVHFDIIQNTDTYLQHGFANSYGPSQISRFLQNDHPTIFDFKIPLGTYLGQMSAFTVGLTLYNANRNEEALPFFITAGEAVDQLLAADMQRAIRFFRADNYIYLHRPQDAQPDLLFLIPDKATKATDLEEFALDSLNALSIATADMGDYRSASAYAEQSIPLYADLNDLPGQATALANLGNIAITQGDLVSADKNLKRALSLFTMSNNRQGQANTLMNLSRLVEKQADYRGASDYLEHALALYVDADDLSGQVAALTNLGSLKRQQGNIAAALHYLKKAQSLSSDLGSIYHSVQLTNLGWIAIDQGDYEAAHSYLEQAFSLSTESDLPFRAARLSDLGWVAMQQGDYIRSRNYTEQALTLYTQLNDLPEQALQLSHLGLVAYYQTDYVAARAYLEQSLKHYTQLGNTIEQATQLKYLGEVALNQKEFREAYDYYQRSVTLYKLMGQPVDPTVQAALDALNAQQKATQ